MASISPRETTLTVSQDAPTWFSGQLSPKRAPRPPVHSKQKVSVTRSVVPFRHDNPVAPEQPRAPLFFKRRGDLNLVDVSTKRGIESEHFSSRYGAALQADVRAFHKKQGSMGRYMEKAVQARALLPVQPGHERLSSFEASLPKVLGVRPAEVTPDTLRDVFGEMPKTGAAAVALSPQHRAPRSSARPSSRGRRLSTPSQSTAQRPAAVTGPPSPNKWELTEARKRNTSKKTRGQGPGAGAWGRDWGWAKTQEEAHLARIVLQSRALARLSPRTSRRVSAAFIDEEPWHNEKIQAEFEAGRQRTARHTARLGQRRRSSQAAASISGGAARVSPRGPVMGDRRSYRTQMLSARGEPSSPRIVSPRSNYNWQQLTRPANLKPSEEYQSPSLRAHLRFASPRRDSTQSPRPSAGPSVSSAPSNPSVPTVLSVPTTVLGDPSSVSTLDTVTRQSSAGAGAGARRASSSTVPSTGRASEPPPAAPSAPASLAPGSVAQILGSQAGDPWEALEAEEAMNEINEFEQRHAASINRPQLDNVLAFLTEHPPPK